MASSSGASGLDLALFNSVACALSVVPTPRILADAAPAELKSVILNAPRLYGFSHRTCLSLRHPRLRLVARMAAEYDQYQRHQQALKAQQQHQQGGRRGRGPSAAMGETSMNMHSSPLSPSSHSHHVPHPIDLLSAVDCAASSVDGPSLVVEEAYTWREVGSYYDALVEVMEDEGGALYGFQGEGVTKGSVRGDGDGDGYACEGDRNEGVEEGAGYVADLIDANLYKAADTLIGGTMGIATAAARDALRTPIEVCRYRLERDVGIDDVLRRYWAMLSKASLQEYEEEYVHHIRRPDASSSIPRPQPAGRMPPSSYLTLMMKLSGIVYHRDALVDLLDFMVGDLLWDAANLPDADVWEPQQHEENSDGDGDGTANDKDADDDDAGVGFSFAEHVARTLGNSVYAAVDPMGGEGKGGARRGGGTNAAPSASSSLPPVEALPSLSYHQFKLSMLELADNWTGTVHPHEWAALLWEWYTKAFSVDAVRQQQLCKNTKGRHADITSKINTGAAKGGGSSAKHSGDGPLRPTPPPSASGGGSPSSLQSRYATAKRDGKGYGDAAMGGGDGKASLDQLLGDRQHGEEGGADPSIEGGGAYSKWVEQWQRAKERQQQKGEDGANSSPLHSSSPLDDRGAEPSHHDESERYALYKALAEEEALRSGGDPTSTNATIGLAAGLSDAELRGSRGANVLSASPNGAGVGGAVGGGGSPYSTGRMRFGMDGIAIVPQLPFVEGHGLEPEREGANAGNLGSPKRRGRMAGNIIIYSVLDWHRQQMRAAYRQQLIAEGRAGADAANSPISSARQQQGGDGDALFGPQLGTVDRSVASLSPHRSPLFGGGVGPRSPLAASSAGAPNVNGANRYHHGGVTVVPAGGNGGGTNGASAASPSSSQYRGGGSPIRDGASSSSPYVRVAPAHGLDECEGGSSRYRGAPSLTAAPPPSAPAQPAMVATSAGATMSVGGSGVQSSRPLNAPQAVTHYTSTHLFHKNSAAGGGGSGNAKESHAYASGTATANGFRSAPIYLYELTTAGRVGGNGLSLGRRRMSSSSAAAANTSSRMRRRRGQPFPPPLSASSSSPHRTHPSFGTTHFHLRHYFRGMLRPLVMGEAYGRQRMVGPDGEDFYADDVEEELD